MKFLSLLTIAFIVLKLTGFIAWSWIWALAPIWIPLVAVILFLIGFVALDILTDNGKNL